MKIVGIGLLIALLAGCASTPPAAISRSPAPSLTLAEVRAQPERFLGSEVRWGGVITAVENKAQVTWIEVLARDLKKDGKPRLDDGSEGRFIASFSGFADPQV